MVSRRFAIGDRVSCAGCSRASDAEQARECVRTIAGWKRLRPVRLRPHKTG
jgi:hypothetical protein